MQDVYHQLYGSRLGVELRGAGFEVGGCGFKAFFQPRVQSSGLRGKIEAFNN